MEETTIEQLKKFLGSINGENITSKEFSTAIQKIAELIMKIKEDQDESISDIEDAYAAILSKLRNNAEQAYSDLRGKVDNLFVENKLEEMKGTNEAHIAEMKKMMSEMIESKMKEMDIGMNGMKTKVSNLKPIEGRPGRNGSPDTPEMIAAKLNTKEGIVDLSVIKGGKEALRLLDQKITFAVSKGGAAAPRGRMHYYDLSDSLDGVTKTFVLPAFWNVIGVFGTSSPTVFRPTIDYTLSGVEITFTDQIDATTVLASGQTVIIQYEEA